MRAHPIIALVLLVTLPLQSTHACLWDSDTLAMEAAGKGKILDIIVGRFPRNPAVYYEARLERVTREIASDPDKLDLYDDAGVACDRLHRSAEAVAWMEKKAAVLERSPNKEHQYRYHANLGTFLIHQWLSEGAEATRDEGSRGAEHIRKAIEINPDAHFGREAIQLQAIEWLLEERSLEIGDQSKPNLFRTASRSGYVRGTEDVEKAVEGLAGMVALGAAWESVDVFRTLAACLSGNGSASLAYLAECRVVQLLHEGNESLSNYSAPAQDYVARGRSLDKKDHLTKWFSEARIAADAWQTARTDYIEKQVAAGQHPDTHPKFWKGFDETQFPSPKLPEERPSSRGLSDAIGRTAKIFRMIVFASFAITLGWIGFTISRRLSPPSA